MNATKYVLKVVSFFFSKNKIYTSIPIVESHMTTVTCIKIKIRYLFTNFFKINYEKLVVYIHKTDSIKSVKYKSYRKKRPIEIYHIIMYKKQPSNNVNSLESYSS